MISPLSQILAGTAIMPGVVINAICLVKENVIINTNSSIDHDCIVMEHCQNRYLVGCKKIILPLQQPWAKNIYWLYTILLPPELARFRDIVIKCLAEANIETRSVFYPAHTLPPYSKFAEGQSYPTADLIACSGINLPTHANLSEDEIEYICECLIGIIEGLSGK